MTGSGQVTDHLARVLFLRHSFTVLPLGPVEAADVNEETRCLVLVPATAAQ